MDIHFVKELEGKRGSSRTGEWRTGADKANFFSWRIRIREINY